MSFSFLRERGWPLPIGRWARKKRQRDVRKWPPIFAPISGKIRKKRIYKKRDEPDEGMETCAAPQWRARKRAPPACKQGESQYK